MLHSRYFQRMLEIENATKSPLHNGESVLVCSSALSIPFGWLGTVSDTADSGSSVRINCQNAWSIWSPRSRLISQKVCQTQRHWRNPPFKWNEVWNAYQKHAQSGFLLPPFFKKLQAFATENRLNICTFQCVGDPEYSYYPSDATRPLALVQWEKESEVWIVGTPDGSWRSENLKR